jgi:heat shock protein HslJ
MRLRWLVLPLLLVATGCGVRAPAGSAPAPESDPLSGQTFVGGEVTVEGKPHALVADTELSVEFTDDGRLVARAGCNMMQASVDTAEGKLLIQDGLSTTDIGCDKARHDQDVFIAGVLGAMPTWQLDGSRLEITSDTTTLLLTERSVAKPDFPLAGTTWTLDTLVDGDVASSTPAGAKPVTLVFDGKRVVADTGCNGAGGEYTLTGNRLTVTPGASTKMMCAPDIMQLEEAVASVLDGEVEVEITADRLTLDHPSGKGIQLRAQ